MTCVRACGQKHTHLEQLWRQVRDCAAAAPVGDVVLAQQQLHQPKVACSYMNASGISHNCAYKN
jgi:hypothetical protein